MKDQYLDWILNGKTGISSMTIMCVLNGRPAPRHGFDTPHDMADVQRCVNMLALFPELETRLQEVAAQLPAWQPFADCWPQLKRLMPEIEAWWALPEAEQKKQARKKRGYDKASHAFQLVQKLAFAGHYLAGMRCQGSDGSMRRTAPAPTPQKGAPEA